MNKKPLPRLVLIDGNALVHRAFHALPPLTTKKGELVNAVYGFTTTLLKSLKDLQPTYCAVTFDLAAPTFRHIEYKEYKATRVKADQSLYDQIPRVKEIVRTLNIPIFEKEGFEADDIIGTLATQAAKQNIEIVIVTGDLDTLQLVNHLVRVYTMKRGLTDMVIYDSEAVKEKYSLTPEQFIDYKALRGDPSDNIPGVPGVGEKTATQLLIKYDSIEGIFQHLDELPDRQRQLLKSNQENLKTNKRLVTIVCDVPIKLELKECTLHDYDRPAAIKLFQELEFKSLLPRLPASTNSNRDETESPSSAKQGELFTPNQSQPLPFRHHIITNEQDLNQLIADLKKSSGFVIDTESNYLDGGLIGLSFAYNKTHAWYVPVAHKANLTPKGQLQKSLVLKKLRPILENIHLPKGGHNLKYDYNVLCRENIHLRPLSFDTMIASYLLNPGSRNHNLDSISFTELGYEKIPLTELIGVKKLGNLAEAPLDKVARYSCEDAYTTYLLWQKFTPELKTHGLETLFHELEMPLVSVLADMERLGIKIDTDHLAKLERELEKRLQALEKDIYQEAGIEFNINSPRQLADILFNTLHLASEDIRRGKTGLSTAANELEKLRHTHPIIEKLIKYRELTKLQNTYIEALPKLVLPRDGRVHTNFNQTVTTTGRLSSSNPNLQNIPIRSDMGQEIRRAFIAEAGFTLLSADYSQIELRLMAHIANDEAMIGAFRNNRDIHAETSQSLGVDRRMAKIINFSIIYGTTAYGLSQALGIDTKEAQALIDRYFSRFPKVAKYIDATIRQARQLGYVSTLFGRRRYMPEIKSSNFAVRQGAERAAINLPLQGTAADIIKIAMIKIADYLKPLGKERIRLLLQVHDELVLEVKKEDLPKIAKEVKRLMESAGQFKVPLIAEVKAGPNWRDMQPLNIK